MSERVTTRWHNYDDEELRVMIHALREEIATADTNQDAVAGHDLRCELDQMTAELERRGAAA